MLEAASFIAAMVRFTYIQLWNWRQAALFEDEHVECRKIDFRIFYFRLSYVHMKYNWEIDAVKLNTLVSNILLKTALTGTFAELDHTHKARKEVKVGEEEKPEFQIRTVRINENVNDYQINLPFHLLKYNLLRFGWNGEILRVWRRKRRKRLARLKWRRMRQRRMMSRGKKWRRNEKLKNRILIRVSNRPVISSFVRSLTSIYILLSRFPFVSVDVFIVVEFVASN